MVEQLADSGNGAGMVPECQQKQGRGKRQMRKLQYREVPKSAILQVTGDLMDVETIKKFSGLISRCRTPFLCYRNSLN
jgi:hypothetical protein